VDPRLGRPDDRSGLRGPALAEIARAARILSVRSRREAAGLLVGEWRSAFRGGGIEFEESRPYVPGDDVRAIDWNATARTGTPWLKRFREERSCTLLLALDVSASMGFGTTGRTKAQTSAHAAALLAASAAQAGDPVGFVAFGDRVDTEIPPGRGDAHTWRVIRAAAESSSTPRGATDLGVVADWVRVHARRRSVVVVLSDFRDPAPARSGRPLAVLGRRHDLVAAVVEDRRERELVAAGGLRIAASEQPSRRLVFGTDRRRRDAYRAAAVAQRSALARRLREEGSELVWLDTGADPLRPLVRFFRTRGTQRRGIP
jgi:uncharacterized protein (DUF58 family)